MCCDVIIPVYNSPEWLALCVEAVFLSDVSNAVRQVILVDDCSNQETQFLIQKLCQTYNKLKSIRNEKNSGFVKSCNRGMAICDSDYIMLLNSDCLLATDSVAKMTSMLRENPQVGLICPLSNNAANLSIPIPSNTNYVQIDVTLWESLPNRYYPACTIVGNCMIITRDCYTAIGGLDEAFGMGYGEETDYQFRANAAGFDAIVAGNVYVFHKSQVSFGESNTLNEQKQHNREIFFNRWGEQYMQLLDKYEKNDPVLPATELLARRVERLAAVRCLPFPKSFFDRLDAIDKRETVITFDSAAPEPGLFYRSYLYFREFGFRAFVKKILQKIGGIPQSCSAVASIPACELTSTTATVPNEKIYVHFKDLLILYSGEASRRLAQLAEALSYAGISTDAIQAQRLHRDHLKWYRGCLLLDLSAKDLPDSFFAACEKNHKAIIADGDKDTLLTIAEHLSGVLLREDKQLNWWKERGVPALYVPRQETDGQLACKLNKVAAEITLTYRPWALHQFVRGLLSPAIAFILPHTKPAGGIQAALEHIRILQASGYDAFVINLEGDETTRMIGESEIWVLNGNVFVPNGHLDKMVATQGTTVQYLDEWQKEGEKYYLVQAQEVLLYPLENSQARQEVSKTYLREDIHYLTVSHWCQQWLKEDYGRDAQLIPNGLDLSLFPFKPRGVKTKTIILIEGNCDLASKNIDESFEIANRLNKDEFYIIFVTNYGEPKEWYVCDEFYRSVPNQEMYQMYQRADILLKTSLMESFSYPPLEMMATGGCVVAILNDGNATYLRDGQNCLLFRHGDVEAGVAAIERLHRDSELRNQIAVNALETAKAMTWDPGKVLAAYCGTSVAEALCI